MSYSKDIEIKAGDACYYFRYLEWDTAFFGKESYMLDPERSTLTVSAAIKGMMEETFKNSFITVKIASEYSRELLDFLQSSGFRYIDTEVTLRYSKVLQDKASTDGNIKIIKLEENKELPYQELGSVFSLTRFHYDVHIRSDKADLLWIQYISNYRPSPARHMFVAKFSDKTAGTILVNENKENKTAVLFFVSVLEKFRDKKVGSELIKHIVRYFDGYELTTETQIRNIKAINFYIKNDFSVLAATKTVLHRWN